MASAPDSGNGRVVRLTAERLRRLERRMEKVENAIGSLDARLDETTARLDQAVDVLTRLVRVVALQNDRVNRNFGRLGLRLDRLPRSILVGRTADTRRLAALERRLESMERRLT